VSFLRRVRPIATAIGGPIRFAQTTGYFRSALAGKAMDRYGNPLPWYCMPAIEFMDIMDFTDSDVLEFGSGQSTLWWAARARSVIAVEDSETWFSYVNSGLADSPNARVQLEANLGQHAEYPLSLEKQFHMVVIDGGDRAKCARTATSVLAPGGMIVLDNSEGWWGPEGTYPILDHLAAEGFMRVDFNGYAPGVITTSVTSLFFQPNCHRLMHLPPPRRGHR